jgi:hypothetical protein
VRQLCFKILKVCLEKALWSVHDLISAGSELNNEAEQSWKVLETRGRTKLTWALEKRRIWSLYLY